MRVNALLSVSFQFLHLLLLPRYPPSVTFLTNNSCIQLLEFATQQIKSSQNDTELHFFQFAVEHKRHRHQTSSALSHIMNLFCERYKAIQQFHAAKNPKGSGLVITLN